MCRNMISISMMQFHYCIFFTDISKKEERERERERKKGRQHLLSLSVACLKLNFDPF
jgi:hypothetical protein